MTAFLVPGILFTIFFFSNTLLWTKGSSAAVPFGTLLVLLVLWIFISVPMTFVGAYFGFKKRGIEAPVRTNKIPRQVPEQTFYTKPLPGMLMGGILPFGCIFIQLFFILNSIWLVILILLLCFHDIYSLLQGSSNLLYVRILVPGLLDPDHYLLGSYHSSCLLPSLCRRLPLVVEIVYDKWIHCNLSLHLLHSFLQYKTYD